MRVRALAAAAALAFVGAAMVAPPAHAADPEDWECISSTEFKAIKAVQDIRYTYQQAHTRAQSYELFGNATHDYDGQLYGIEGYRKFRGCLGFPGQVFVYVSYYTPDDAPDKVKLAQWCDERYTYCEYPWSL
jgi:hypothetical protein